MRVRLVVFLVAQVFVVTMNVESNSLIGGR